MYDEKGGTNSHDHLSPFCDPVKSPSCFFVSRSGMILNCIMMRRIHRFTKVLTSYFLQVFNLKLKSLLTSLERLELIFSLKKSPEPLQNIFVSISLVICRYVCACNNLIIYISFRLSICLPFFSFARKFNVL